MVTVTATPLRGGHEAWAVAYCPAGKKPVGGGFDLGLQPMFVLGSQPQGLANDGPPGWKVRVNNVSGQDRTFLVYAVCASAP
jgi:hypothetical protein